MSLSASDLIDPVGKLQAAMFPGGDIVTKVEAWLYQANNKAVQAGVTADYWDAAATAYTYHLAYSHVADRLAAEPNSVTIDSAANLKKDVGQDRIEYFRRQAAQYLDEFNVYVPVPVRQSKPRSGFVRNRGIF